MTVRTTLTKWVPALVVFLLTMSLTLGTSAQALLWPGDINNNGQVSKVDILYWAVARGDNGPKRDNTGTNWDSYDSASDWDEDFLNGLNYSQGDADGRGKIANGDRNAIRDNYMLTHGTVTPDAFMTGNPSTDPSLLLVAQNPSVYPGETVTFDIFLGDAQFPVDHFFGIVFTINFESDYIAENTNNPWNPDVADVDLLSNTWLNGSGSSSSRRYQYLREEEGALDVAFLRDDLGQNSGHGQVAEFSIVIEDIVFLNDVNTCFTIDEIKLIDDNMVEYPVASSTECITVMSNSQALTTQSTGLVPSEDVASADSKRGEAEEAKGALEDVEVIMPETNSAEESIRVKLYPNPSAEWMQIDFGSAAENVEQITIYNQWGVVLRQLDIAENSQQLIDIANLPSGNYYLHINGKSGRKSVMQFSKAAN